MNARASSRDRDDDRGKEERKRRRTVLHPQLRAVLCMCALLNLHPGEPQSYVLPVW